MYDLEIIVPAEMNDKIIHKRFEGFKKWGFINIGDTKIKLILLISVDNNKEDLLTGWPEGIDVEVITTPYKHVTQRIYYYYSSIIKPDTAKWYVRLDEDSMTDIKTIMYHLEKSFDPEREYHINCDSEINTENVEFNILTHLGYNWWYNHIETYPTHDYEISITSNAAIKRIFNYPDTYKYFELRQQFAEGHGDHGLCYCAKMVKIYHTEVNWLTIDPQITKFSLFGGHFAHVHHIAYDQNPCVHTWLNSLDQTKLHLFEKNTFIFFEERENQFRKEWIKLNSNQTTTMIIMAEKHEEDIEIPTLWGVTKEGKLTIFFAHFEKNDPLIVLEEENGSFFFNQYKMLKINNSAI